MKLLFITATRVGDAILSTGLLGHLLDRHPHAQVTIVCGAAPADLFRPLPGLERLIVLHKKKYDRHWLELWQKVVRCRWDLVVDLRGSLLAWAIRADRRIVWRKPKESSHRVVQLSRLMKLSQPAMPRFWCDAAAQAQAQALLPSDRPVLALGPTANWVGKQWPIARYIELAHRLTAENGPLPMACVAVFGAPNERSHAALLFEAFAGRVIDGFALGDLVAVGAALRCCQLYIGNDSGLMHLAAAAGVPTLGLFGPSPSQLYRPWGKRTAFVQTARSYPDHLAALRRDPCQIDRLMDDLPVEAAFTAACTLLHEGDR